MRYVRCFELTNYVFKSRAKYRIITITAKLITGFGKLEVIAHICKLVYILCRKRKLAKPA